MFDNSMPRWGHHTDRGSIVTFRDALGLAMGFADDFAFVNAALLLSADATIQRVIMTEGIGQSISPIVERLSGRAGTGRLTNPAIQAPVVAAVLISVRPFEMDIIRESDLALFRRASWALIGIGIDLMDWIETDGDLFRSYAYVTCPATAWPNDPANERLEGG